MNMGSGGIAPPMLTLILDGGEGSATLPGQFTSGGIHPRYPLDMRLGGPQGWSGRRGEEVKLTSAEIRTPADQPVACRYTD
jgi:hypothetical protein